MNQIFSFARVRLLFSRHFREKGKRELIMILTLLGIITFLNSFAPIPFIIVLIIIGMVYSGQIFDSLSPAQRGMNYLLIPASSFEKLFVNWVLTHIYFFILLAATYFLGSYLGGHIRAIVYPNYPIVSAPIDIHISDFFRNLHLYIFHYFALQSVMMFGSVYFKKRAAMKTLLSILGIITAIALLDRAVVMLQIHPSYMMGIGNLESTTLEYITEGIMICFFWVLSYVRLKETEV